MFEQKRTAESVPSKELTTCRRVDVRTEVAEAPIDAVWSLCIWPFPVQAARVRQLSLPHYVGVSESRQLPAA
jgi:hypothetical protein